MGTNIQNKSDGQVLYASELFKLMTEDGTGGNTVNTTTEAVIGSAIVTPSQASQGVLVIANGKANHGAAHSSTNTIKLYSGTSTTFSNNTLRRTITRYGKTTTGTDDVESGWTISDFVTTETWTEQIYIHITGDNNTGTNGSAVYCEGITVIGV